MLHGSNQVGDVGVYDVAESTGSDRYSLLSSSLPDRSSTIATISVNTSSDVVVGEFFRWTTPLWRRPFTAGNRTTQTGRRSKTAVTVPSGLCCAGDEAENNAQKISWRDPLTCALNDRVAVVSAAPGDNLGRSFNGASN